MPWTIFSSAASLPSSIPPSIHPSIHPQRSGAGMRGKPSWKPNEVREKSMKISLGPCLMQTEIKLQDSPEACRNGDTLACLLKPAIWRHVLSGLRHVIWFCMQGQRAKLHKKEGTRTAGTLTAGDWRGGWNHFTSDASFTRNPANTHLCKLKSVTYIVPGDLY